MVLVSARVQKERLRYPSSTDLGALYGIWYPELLVGLATRKFSIVELVLFLVQLLLLLRSTFFILKKPVKAQPLLAAPRHSMPGSLGAQR
eukprot:SAG31_NODE_2896_length_4936_cov_5.275377_1_plen_90_part_00